MLVIRKYMQLLLNVIVINLFFKNEVKQNENIVYIS